MCLKGYNHSMQDKNWRSLFAHETTKLCSIRFSRMQEQTTHRQIKMVMVHLKDNLAYLLETSSRLL